MTYSTELNQEKIELLEGIYKTGLPLIIEGHRISTQLNQNIAKFYSEKFDVVFLTTADLTALYNEGNRSYLQGNNQFVLTRYNLKQEILDEIGSHVLLKIHGNTRNDEFYFNIKLVEKSPMKVIDLNDKNTYAILDNLNNTQYSITVLERFKPLQMEVYDSATLTVLKKTVSGRYQECLFQCTSNYTDSGFKPALVTVDFDKLGMTDTLKAISYLKHMTLLTGMFFVVTSNNPLSADDKFRLENYCIPV